VRIRPLSLAALGVGMVAFDPRIVAWDGLPDALGWALLALAAHRLDMRAPSMLAGAAALAALAELQLPYHYEALDPLSFEVVPNPEPGTDYPERLAFLPLVGVRVALVLAALALGGLALTLMLRELARRSATTPDHTSTKRLRVLSLVVPLVWIAPTLALSIGRLLANDGLDPVWNGGWESGALVTLVVAVPVVYLFATTSNRRWSASGDEVGSPWAELMVRDVP
jgi:hypothetical protein